ncbi:hypothetical protein DLI06_24915, partial [Vibrio parahaemolyticus]|nr:hypothetical protein [Vibrio parahaemolyticus]
SEGVYIEIDVDPRDYWVQYWFPEIYTNSAAGFLYAYVNDTLSYYSSSNYAGSASYKTLRYFGFSLSVPPSIGASKITIKLRNQTPPGTSNSSVGLPKQRFLVQYWKK